MRRGAGGKRRDANEVEIIKTLRSVGASVEQLSGDDLPDLVVGFRGRNHLMEVKTKKGKLSRGQKKWHQFWRGEACVVRTPIEALAALGIAATISKE